MRLINIAIVSLKYEIDETVLSLLYMLMYNICVIFIIFCCKNVVNKLDLLLLLILNVKMYNMIMLNCIKMNSHYS